MFLSTICCHYKREELNGVYIVYRFAYSQSEVSMSLANLGVILVLRTLK